MKELTHLNKQGKASMVDVSQKPDNLRVARATGFIHLSPETLALVQEHTIKKGDVITVAEIAGIQAAKLTSLLIPLCHQINLTKVEVNCRTEKDGIRVNSLSKCIGQTGVEMEALTAVNVALLTIYDMCKAVDKQMVLGDIQLISKEKRKTQENG